MVPPAQPLALRVSVEGEQTTRLGGGVMVGAEGFALISSPVTAVLASDVQPFTVQVAVTEYVPTTDSTKLVPVAAPSDQVIIPPVHPFAVSVSVEGEQTERLGGGEMLGGNAWLIVTTVVALAEHPLALVAVNVYVPLAAVVTLLILGF
jgi:hypothetical protein